MGQSPQAQNSFFNILVSSPQFPHLRGSGSY